MAYKNISKEKVILYLKLERKKILNEITPGSNEIKTREIICDNQLFIPIPWSYLYKKKENDDKDLITRMIDIISFNKGNLLLLGEPGQGKTTILKKVFIELISKYIDDKTDKFPIPIYISFHDLSKSREPDKNDIYILWEVLYRRNSALPFNYDVFELLSQNNDVIYLLDGLDEMTSELNQTSINENLKSSIFDYSSILTCRIDFYETFLSEGKIKRQYESKICLLPLEYNELLRNYIKNFCKRKDFPHDKIFNLFNNNTNIKDLIRRPLLLMMVLDIFTNKVYFEKFYNLKTWGIAKLECVKGPSPDT